MTNIYLMISRGVSMEKRSHLGIRICSVKLIIVVILMPGQTSYVLQIYSEGINVCSLKLLYGNVFLIICK